MFAELYPDEDKKYAEQFEILKIEKDYYKFKDIEEILRC